MVDDFPAPFGPRKLKISPAASSKLMLLIMVLLKKVLMD